MRTHEGGTTAGVVPITAAITMFVGAALWASTGTDIDAALVGDDLPGYLVAAAGHRTVLVANLCVWLVGALGLGAGGVLLAGSGTGPTPQLARYVYGVGASVAVCAFVAWLAILVQGTATPDGTEVAIARVVGWLAYRLDVVATALLIGVGPATLALDRALGRWLRIWGGVALLAALVSVTPYLLGAPLVLSFPIIPIGLGWTIAAGVAVLRSRRAAEVPAPNA